MKKIEKFINFCSNLLFVKKFKEYKHLRFHLENIFGSNLIMNIYTEVILLKVYQNDKIKYSDFIFETDKMQWDLQQDEIGFWNWYEIPKNKINKQNEDIIIQLIQKSYDITYADLKEYNDLNKKIYELNLDGESLLDALIEFRKAQYLRDIILENKRDSILLLENNIKEESIKNSGVSKFGGDPDIPINFKWPKFKNKPLTFYAQINLSEIENTNSNLPKEGIIYIFIAVTNAYKDYINFIENIKEDVVKIYYYNVNKDQLKRKIHRHYKFKEVIIKTKLVSSYPEEELEPLFKNYKLSENNIKLINDIADMYSETIDEKLHIISHHNMLGYHKPVQYLAEEIQKNDDYIPLIQISSSEAIGMNWGDSGIFYIYINRNDLKNLDFTKIIIDTQG